MDRIPAAPTRREDIGETVIPHIYFSLNIIGQCGTGNIAIEGIYLENTLKIA